MLFQLYRSMKNSSLLRGGIMFESDLFTFSQLMDKELLERLSSVIPDQLTREDIEQAKKLEAFASSFLNDKTDSLKSLLSHLADKTATKHEVSGKVDRLNLLVIAGTEADSVKDLQRLVIDLNYCIKQYEVFQAGGVQ